MNFRLPETWGQWVVGDVAISCLGTTAKDTANQDEYWRIDYGYQWQFAQFAKQNGVKQFVLLSAMFANPKAKVFYSRMKGQLEQDITGLGFERLTIFRPPSLVLPHTDRFGEKVAVAVFGWLGRVGLLTAQKPVPVDVLARAMWKVVENGEVGIVESGEIWRLGE